MERINISEKILNYRRKNKLTQKEFGVLLGVSMQAVSKWERVKCYPDITFLPKLAEILNCTINDFFS